jgi:hypothetical protein
MNDTALAQLLEELDFCGARLSVDRTGGLRIHGAAQLAPDLLNNIRNHKEQIVAHLSNATLSAYCHAASYLAHLQNRAGVHGL